MEEEEKGMSLVDIFKTIFSQKWLALILFLVITVLGVVGLRFIYTPRVAVYTVQFRLNLPNINNGQSYYIYPDGKIYYFSEMVSGKNLGEVKASDDDFKDIDVATMASKGDITLSSALVVQDGKTSDDKLFTLTVKQKYFDDKDVAMKFLTAVIAQPGEYINIMGIDHNIYINLSENAIDYANQLEYLDYQLEYLADRYRQLISTFGDSYTVDDNRTLSSYYQELNLYRSRNDITSLEIEALDNYYIKSEELKERFRLELVDLERELQIAKYTLDNLTQHTSADFSDSAAVIKAQSDLVANLEQRKGDLTNYYNNGTVNSAFDAKIETVAADIEKLTETFGAVSSMAYHKSSAVSYANSEIIKSEGGMGLVKSGLISVVVGIVVALLVAYIVGRIMKDFKKNNTESGNAVPFTAATALPQAEAAATDSAATSEKSEKH